MVFIINGALPLLGQSTIYEFNLLSGVDNLSSLQKNYYFHKDKKGFVWIGTFNGINRYDGIEIKQYQSDENDSTSILDPFIQSHFFEDQEGDIWFATYQGLNKYHRDYDHFSSRQINGKDEYYRLYLLDNQKDILLASVKDSLFLVPTDSQKPIVNLGTFRESGAVKERLTASDDTYHYLFNLGNFGIQIYLFERSNFEKGKFTKKEIPLKNTPEAIYFESQERIWIGTPDGLLLLNSLTGESRMFDEWKGEKIGSIVSVDKIDETFFLVSTKESGIFLYERDFGFKERLLWNDRGKVQPFIKPFEKIYLDEDQTIWASVAGEGLYFANINKPKFKSALFEQPNSLPNCNIIRGFAQDSSGLIWCLSANGISILNPDGSPNDEFDFRGDKVPFSSKEAYSIICDHKNRIWIASNQGLFFLSRSAKKFKKIQSSIAQDFVYLLRIKGDRLIASTYAQGIVEIVESKNETFATIPFEECKVREGFTLLFEDRSNTLYFTKPVSGIYIPKKEGENFTHDIIPTTATINGMVEDEEKNLIWVASSIGLMRLEDKKLVVEKAFPSVILKGILMDEKGNLWLSSNNGLYKFNPKSKHVQQFNQFDGLQHLEFNFWSYLKTFDGKFLFGSTNGLNIFDPTQVANQVAKASPTITKIKIDSKVFERIFLDEKKESISVSEIKFIPELDHDQNNISFSLALLEYSAPSKSGFKYQLINHDEQPISVTGENEATYKNLSPGDYTFEVFALNSDGVKSKNSSTINFTIMPPWYNTWWFYLLVFSSTIGSIFIYYKRRIKQITEWAKMETKVANSQKENAEMEAQIANDKKQKAEMETQIAENKMAALRAQMNPHFIFNSLNSINSYILNNDISQASIYVGKFSKLMRMILNLSAFPVISVEKEIEILKLYMEVEQLRFKKPFEFEFKINEDEVDPFDTEVPTMLLQPFVENSIWHGLAAKEDGVGKITIQMTSENDLLKCVVKDNGIGREAAAKIKKQKGRAHKSKALDIVKDRLRILHANATDHHTIEIIDLKDPNGNATGTAVEIVLPLYYE